jgi:hypothetical protein
VAVAGTTEPVTGQGGAGGRVVEASDEPGGAVQPGVWQPRRGADDHLAGEAGEHLAALGIDAEQPRCTVEADRLQVPQEGMDVVGSLMQRPAHRLADPDDAVRPAAAGKGLLGQLVHEPSLGRSDEHDDAVAPKPRGELRGGRGRARRRAAWPFLLCEQLTDY